MKEKLCMGCMNMIPEQDKKCSVCGFDEKIYGQNACGSFYCYGNNR